MRNTCLNNKIKELFDKRKRKIALLYSYNTKNILNERQLKIRELSLFLLFKLKIVYLYVSGEVDDIVTAVNLCLDKQYTKEDPDAYDQLARFLGYHGVGITGKNLKEAVETETYIKSVVSQYSFPDVDIREILDKALIELGHQASPFLIAESALVLRAATTCITPVKGAMDAVTTLVDAGYRLCICSNTQRAFTIGELRAFGLLSFFNPIVFSSDVGACKPEMAIFNRIIELTGIANPSDIVPY